jgi:hypothetical protein
VVRTAARAATAVRTNVFPPARSGQAARPPLVRSPSPPHLPESRAALLLSQQILLNFVMAYEDIAKREVITDLKEIRRSYMRGFFVIDLLSILPVNYIVRGTRPYL